MINLGDAGKQKEERYRPPEPPQDPVEGFAMAMAKFDLVPESIEPSGKLVRFDIEKRGDGAGWYVFFLGGISSGAFGNWKTGLKQTWCNKERRDMTDAESESYQRMVADARRQRKEQEERDHAAAKIRAKKIWGEVVPASPDHPYLVRKGVDAHGLKESRGKLVVPVKDEHGELWNLQFIDGDGEKKFLKGGRVEGCSFTIPGDEKLLICEGYATGASLHEATGATVITAYNAGNLPKVAEVVRRVCPTSPITICADDDRFTAGNPGRSKAEEAAKSISAEVVYPVFDGLPGANDPEKKLSDFNDLHAIAGIEAVRTQMAKPGKRTKLPPQGPEATNFLKTVKTRPAPLDFIFRFNDRGLIPRGVVGVLSATGGTGKTFFLLSMAMAGAAGRNFGPINAPKPVSTLVVIGEDSQDELERRSWDISKGKFPPLFHALSVYGEVGPLMRLEGSTPVFADGYYWLEETVGRHPGLDLLILDPKSRFYGLDENNNDHSTQWIQGLEGLSKRHDLTILFSSHTGKENAGKISQNMNRGAGAIVDGCRWSAGLVRMDEKTAEKYGVENPRDYILFDAPKSNYAADLPGQICFRRGDGGVLQYVEPDQELLKNMAEELIEKLKMDPTSYTKRDLIKQPVGASVSREMKEIFPGFRRRVDMERSINWLLDRGLLSIEFTNPGRNAKEILRVNS